MANRYWVGGTATWNATAGTKWALTSGGAGGQAVPTTSDDVFFDAASGAVTCTTGATINVKSLNFTGFTGTFAGSNSMNMAPGGTLTLGSGMTITYTGDLNASSAGTINITSNGKQYTGTLTTNDVATTYSFNDDFDCSGTIGTFGVNGMVWTTNDHNMKLKQFITGNFTATINMGSGTWEITNAGNPWRMSSDFVTLNASTSTLKFTNTTNTDLSIQFNTDGSPSLTYYNVWFARGASTGANEWSTAAVCSFNGYRDTGTAAHTLGFPAGKTTTIRDATAWLVNGTAGNLITLTSFAGDTATHTISCSSGTISSDYLVVQHSVATGGASFYAGANSTNNQAVATAGSGWIFTAPPTVNKGAFFNFFT